MRQIDLFAAPAGGQLEAELALDDQALQAWRLRVLAYQQPLRQGTPASAAQQANLFETESQTDHRPPDPLTLPAQHLQFWRWPEALNQGAALYYVFDHGLGPERGLHGLSGPRRQDSGTVLRAAFLGRMPVCISPEPLHAVALGSGKSLESFDSLKGVLFSSSQD